MMYIRFRDVGNTEFLPHHSKHIAPLVGAALVSGASSLLGGLFGKSSADKAAQAQLQAARETNQMNYQIAQENNAFNERMQDKQNDYNSAVNQRKRLEEAGLNPNLMMDGGSAGVSTTTPTADVTGKQVVPDVAGPLSQGGQILANTISQAGLNISDIIAQQSVRDSQARKNNADADTADIDNMTRNAENLARIEQMKQDINHKTALWKNLNLSTKLLQESFNDQLHNYRLQNVKLDADAQLSLAHKSLVEVNEQIQRENLKWLPKEKEAGLSQILAQTTMQLAAAGASKAQAEAAYAQAALTYAQEQGVKVDNEVKRDTKQFAKHIVQNQSANGYIDWKQKRDENEFYNSDWSKWQRKADAVVSPVSKLPIGLIFGK